MAAQGPLPQYKKAGLPLGRRPEKNSNPQCFYGGKPRALGFESRSRLKAHRGRSPESRPTTHRKCRKSSILDEGSFPVWPVNAFRPPETMAKKKNEPSAQAGERSKSIVLETIKKRPGRTNESHSVWRRCRHSPWLRQALGVSDGFTFNGVPISG